MTKPNLTFREGVAQLNRLARESAAGSAHAPTVRLVAYRRGELPEAEAAALAEHLSICPTCANELLEIAELFGPEPTESEEDAEEETEEEAQNESGKRTEADERLWRRIEAELRPAASPIDAAEIRPTIVPRTLSDSRPAIPAPKPTRSIFRSLPVAYALAAGFAALSLGSIFFGRHNSSDSTPRLNEGLYDLSDRGTERGIAAIDGAKTIRFEAGASSAILVLNPIRTPPASGTFGVRFRRVDGGVAWQAERGLVPQRLGTFQIGISRGSFPPGRYTVELFESRHDGERPLGTFPISIEK